MRTTPTVGYPAFWAACSMAEELLPFAPEHPLSCSCHRHHKPWEESNASWSSAVSCTDPLLPLGPRHRWLKALGHPIREVTMQIRLSRASAELGLPLCKWRNTVGVCREQLQHCFGEGRSWFADRCAPSEHVSASLGKPGRSNSSQHSSKQISDQLKASPGGL